MKECGFDFVEGLFMENLVSEGEFNNYSDGTFSHNMEWITYEAIDFINSSVSAGVSVFITVIRFCMLCNVLM